MKKSTKLIIALLAIVAALAVTYRLMNRVPSTDLEANAQMQQLISDAGCLRCHTSTPDVPFYASFPIAGKIVMDDVSNAYRVFDMTPMAEDMKAGRPLNPVDVAKVESVILNGTMPQAKYYLVHWGSSLTDAKKEIALSWVKNHRMTLYTDASVAPDFKNEPIRPIADSIAVDVRKVVLGNLLYHDTRLSADNTISCA
ncbi:MAG: heme-binding domain-containing protein, partial [Muribaculaceae bacterium]